MALDLRPDDFRNAVYVRSTDTVIRETQEIVSRLNGLARELRDAGFEVHVNTARSGPMDPLNPEPPGVFLDLRRRIG